MTRTGEIWSRGTDGSRYPRLDLKFGSAVTPPARNRRSNRWWTLDTTADEGLDTTPDKKKSRRESEENWRSENWKNVWKLERPGRNEKYRGIPVGKNELILLSDVVSCGTDRQSPWERGAVGCSRWATASANSTTEANHRSPENLARWGTEGKIRALRLADRSAPILRSQLDFWRLESRVNVLLKRSRRRSKVSNFVKYFSDEKYSDEIEFEA